MKLFKPALYKRPVLVGFIVFILVLAVTQLLTYHNYLLSKNQIQELSRKQAYLVKKELQSILNQGFATTQTLSFFADTYGVPQHFDSIASLLFKTHKKVDVLGLTNDKGELTHVYPNEENAVLHFNFLLDSTAKSTTLKTIQRKDYFVTDPIRYNRINNSILCKTPVFKDNTYNGFSIALIQLPPLLNATSTGTYTKSEYSYRLSKINKDGSEKVFFSAKDISLSKAFNIPITTQNGAWKLYVFSNNNSYLSSIFSFGILGFLLAILSGVYVTYILKQPLKLIALTRKNTAMLKISNEKYKSLFEQASDGIFITDIKGNIINVNPIGTEMFGYTKEELLRKNLKDISEPQELSNTPLKFAEIKKGNPVLNERKMLRKDGSTFFVEVKAKLLQNNTVQGIVRDTTQRKKLEVLAQDNLKKFSKAFNNNTVGMVISELNNGIVDANACFLNLIGWSLEEVKGKTFTELNLINNASGFKEKVISALKKNDKIEALEVVLKSKMETELHLLSYAEIYDFNDKKYIQSTFIDRTEARKNQLKIAKSEEKYRQLTERISDGFASFDKNWIIRYINPKGSLLVKRTPNELTGKNLWQEFPELANTNAKTILEKAMKTQKYRLYQQFHEKQEIWIENHIYPSPEGLTIYFRDITKAKNADLEKQKLISIIENSPGFIGLASLEGKATFLNEAGRKLVGLPKDVDISNTTIFDFFPETYRPIVLNEQLPSIKNKGSWNGEVPLKNFKTHKIIPTAFSGFIIRDKNTNKGIGIGSVAVDISERLKSEKEILELQSKMNAAIRIGKIGYWDWNVVTETIDWSEQMYTIYDVNPGTNITVPFTQTLVHPDDLGYHNKVLNEKISNRDNSPFSFRIVHRNGDVKHVLVQMEVVEDDHNIHYRYQGTVIDITETKEIQERLEAQNVELQKTNSELDSFVYSASHELRAPLTSILGLVNIIKIEENKPELLSKLSMMENSIKRLDNFIRDIVEFSRNRHLEIRLEKINFRTLINDSIESLWYLENTSKINIIVEINNAVAYYSDKRRMAIILNNFISNAIKYHNTKKNDAAIWITINYTTENAVIVVKDNGHGIKKEHLPKIFDMFFRASSKIMGSGIGLYIVKEIIDKLKGRVQVNAELGKGATFTITLPNELINYKNHESEKNTTNR